MRRRRSFFAVDTLDSIEEDFQPHERASRNFNSTLQFCLLHTISNTSADPICTVTMSVTDRFTMDSTTDNVFEEEKKSNIPGTSNLNYVLHSK